MEWLEWTFSGGTFPILGPATLRDLSEKVFGEGIDRFVTCRGYLVK